MLKWHTGAFPIIFTNQLMHSYCPLFNVLQVVSTQKLDDSQINVILEACWGSLEENRRHPQYWQILSAFVETVYQSCLIVKSEDSVVIQSLNKVSMDGQISYKSKASLAQSSR